MQEFGRLYATRGLRMTRRYAVSRTDALAGCGSRMRFPDYSLLALPDRSRSCRRSKPIRSHQEISRNFPARIDLLNHLQGQRSMSSQHFGRARAKCWLDIDL